MNFFDEISSKVGFDMGILSGKFKITTFFNEIFLLENHFGILQFSADLMQFKVKGGSVFVFGENLTIKEYEKKSVLICGKILKVEFKIDKKSSK